MADHSLPEMVNEVSDDRKVVLTPPASLESTNDQNGSNFLQRIVTLFKKVRPGSDITRFQLPPLFNLPKSQLQCYGESVYCFTEDILSLCARGKTPLDRFTAVVAWSISTLRPVIFGLAPFNPILGETHHVSRGNLNVLLEQVSHHPPVSALHATDENGNVELIWCNHAVPKFHGTLVEAMIHGKRRVKLLKFDETYEMNVPKLQIRFLPRPGTEWSGNVRIRCQESGIGAELCYKNHSFLGMGLSSRSVKGTIFISEPMKIIYTLDGHWDGIVTMKDMESGKSTTLYNAKQTLSKLATPTIKDPKGVWNTESAMVWSEVSQGILKMEWEKATKAKRDIEERERKLDRERKANGEAWKPKHFSLIHTKQGEWECFPKHDSVPTAPIIIPTSL